MKRLVVWTLAAVMAPVGASAQALTYQQMYQQLVPPAAGARPGGGILPQAQYSQPRPYTPPPPPVYYAPPPAPTYTAPANGYGQISPQTGLPRTNYVNGYYRADGTYVQPYYRSR